MDVRIDVIDRERQPDVSRSVSINFGELDEIVLRPENEAGVFELNAPSSGPAMLPVVNAESVGNAGIPWTDVSFGFTGTQS